MVSDCIIHQLFSNIMISHVLIYRTALHWAAKRNHIGIAHCLITNGADKNLESFAKETPADLSTSPAVLNLLGSPLMKNKSDESSESNAITPHYLTQSTTGYKVDLQEQNRSLPGRVIGNQKGKLLIF